MRKFSQKMLLLALIILFILSISSASFAEEKYSKNSFFDTGKLSNGVFGATFQSDKKLKVIVNKSGQKYIYNLSNKGDMQYFPLQMGNGEYTLDLYENISGINYREIANTQITLNLADEKLTFLNKIQEVNWTDNDATTQIAKTLSTNLINDYSKVKTIYRHLISNFRYDYAKLLNIKSDYLPDNLAMINSQKGICYDFSSLFASMLRSQGIPCKMIKGYAKGVSVYHAWNEVYIKELSQWVVMDLSNDSQCREFGFSYKMFKKTGDYNKLKEY